MAAIYRIARWREVFEKSDAAKMKTLYWVSMPIDFGDGYHSLVAEFGTDAAAIYGAWCALVAVAAKAPTRGTLANSKGRPYTMDRITAETRMPAELFERLIPWAMSEDVGWLEVMDSPGEPPRISEDFRESPRTSENLPDTGPNRTEPDITEPYTGRPVADGRDAESVSAEDQPQPVRVTPAMRAEILDLAQEICESIDRRPNKRDAQESLKAAAIARFCDKRLWLDRCLEDVRRKCQRDPPDNRWGYLMRTLRNEAQRDGWDFRAALRVMTFDPLPEPARPAGT